MYVYMYMGAFFVSVCLMHYTYVCVCLHVYFPSFSEIEDFVKTHCAPGDLLITMGAGNVVNIGESLLK